MEIWRLYKGVNQTLPILQRMGAGTQSVNTDIAGTLLPTRVYSKIEAVDIIDVVNQFNWTKSPITSRGNTPFIQLIEKRLVMNSNVSNIANSVFASLGSGEVLTNTLGSIASYLGNSDVGKQVINTITGLTPQEFGQAVTQGAAGSAPVKTTQAIADNVNNFLRNNFQTFDNSVLKPYELLYATEPTGFTYKIPYLDNQYNSGSLTFGEGEGNIISGIAGIASDVASGIAGITGGLKPGTYIERAKQYSMGDRGRTITVRFPLLNTGKYQDILDNWQLIFGLIYQNRPGRVTRAIIDMPVIYEVLVPGVVYMPYAYINSLSISFLGSRRTIDIEVPIFNNDSTAPTVLTTTVPDAYQVEFSIEGMNEETRNLLYANVVSRPVTVSSRQGV